MRIELGGKEGNFLWNYGTKRGEKGKIKGKKRIFKEEKMALFCDFLRVYTEHFCLI